MFITHEQIKSALMEIGFKTVKDETGFRGIPDMMVDECVSIAKQMQLLTVSDLLMFMDEQMPGTTYAYQVLKISEQEVDGVKNENLIVTIPGYSEYRAEVCTTTNSGEVYEAAKALFTAIVSDCMQSGEWMFPPQPLIDGKGEAYPLQVSYLQFLKIINHNQAIPREQVPPAYRADGVGNRSQLH